jgi:hypothetical protein
MVSLCADLRCVSVLQYPLLILIPPDPVVVLLILAPHPSLLFMLVDFHFITMGQPFVFGIHLFVTYFLTFLAFSSLIVCIARDPGPVIMPKPIGSSDADDSLDFTEALMSSSEDFNHHSRWCRKCWVRFSCSCHENCSSMRRRHQNQRELTIVTFVVAVFSKWVSSSTALDRTYPHRCGIDHHCPWLAHKCIVRRNSSRTTKANHILHRVTVHTPHSYIS